MTLSSKILMSVGQELSDLEDVVGVLKGAKGRTFETVYDLFFTDKRMIAAILTHPSDFNDIYRKIDMTTFLLGGFPNEIAFKTRSLDLIRSRRLTFANKTVDEILALHRLNLEIDYENISYVTIKKGLLTKSLQFALKTHPGKKTSFSLAENQIAEAEELVKKVLLGKSKMIAHAQFARASEMLGEMADLCIRKGTKPQMLAKTISELTGMVTDG